MSRSRSLIGTITAGVLVLLFGNQTVTEWVAGQFHDRENPFHFLLSWLTWPSWAFGRSSGESGQILLARDLRAVLVVVFAAAMFAAVAKPGSGGFLISWSVLIFSSALAAFVTAFLVPAPSLIGAVAAAQGGAVYGLFVGWILGITTSRSKSVNQPDRAGRAERDVPTGPKECRYEDHNWEAASPEQDGAGGSVSKISCRYCGVGHSVVIHQTDPSTIETNITVFSAHGSDTISRAVVRWSFFTWEEGIKKMESDGFRVVRGTPSIIGRPAGS